MSRSFMHANVKTYFKARSQSWRWQKQHHHGRNRARLRQALAHEDWFTAGYALPLSNNDEWGRDAWHWRTPLYFQSRFWIPGEDDPTWRDFVH